MNIVGPLARFNTIGREEEAWAQAAIHSGPLSGFIASREDGGNYVSKLERRWAAKLSTKHAISFNSATSALLAAAVATGVRFNNFLVTPFTMSATAAAPMFAGGTPAFMDIEGDTFGIDPWQAMCSEHYKAKALFVTNLFGHTAKLKELREICDVLGMFLVEDASQSPLATENGHLAGTIGHIGVFSLNVHKHIQCGEGGIAVTNDDGLAFKMRCVRNHGENLPGGILGLNLRMTEPIAAIACSQMEKLDGILADRIALAESLTAQVMGLPNIMAPFVRENCRHVYYSWPIMVNGLDVDEFQRRMEARGVPLSRYVKPLYHLDAFKDFAAPCPVAEEVYRKLLLFEICTYSPTKTQVEQIGEAFRLVLNEMK